MTVPFAYAVRLQAPISKKIEDVVRAELIEYDIPEIRGDEAALVATWEHQAQYRRHPWRVECRTYNGGYYYPSGEGRSLTKNDLIRGIPRDEAHSGFFWYDIARHAWFYDGAKQYACRDVLKGNEPRSRAKSALELENDRDIELEKAIKGLSDLIFVDDAVWCRARAPRLALNVHGEPNARYGTIDILAVAMAGSQAGRCHPMEPMRGPDQYRFRISELGEAEEFAKRLGVDCQNLVSDIAILGDIDASMHPETWLTLKAALEAVYSIGNEVGDLPVNVVEMWLDLRSLVEKRDEKVVGDIEGTLRLLHGALGSAANTRSRLSTYFSELEVMRTITTNAVAARTDSPRPA